MDTRKLQQVGGGTYTISIPKRWAVDRGLEAGEMLNLYTHTDGSIVVRSGPKEAEVFDEVRVEVHRRGPDVVTRALRSAQTVGFDTVVLTREGSFTDDERRAVRRAARALVGVELIADGSDELVVRTLLDANDVSIRQTLGHLQFTVLSLHRRGTDALVEGDPEVYDALEERQSEAVRLADLVARHISRSLVSFEEVDNLAVSRSELFEYFLASQGLQRVAEQSVELARLGMRRGAPLPDDVGTELRRLADESRTVVDDATNALLNATTLDPVDDVFAHCATIRRDIDAAEQAVFLDPASAFGFAGSDANTSTASADDTTAAEACLLVSALGVVGRTLDAGEDVATAAAKSVVRSQNHQ